MFTPHRVAGGPGGEVLLNKIRITNGTYVGTGEGFQIIDDYSVASSAHRMLSKGWIGTTHFREINQQVELKVSRAPQDPSRVDCMVSRAPEDPSLGTPAAGHRQTELDRATSRGEKVV